MKKTREIGGGEVEYWQKTNGDFEYCCDHCGRTTSPLLTVSDRGDEREGRHNTMCPDCFRAVIAFAEETGFIHPFATSD